MTDITPELANKFDSMLEDERKTWRATILELVSKIRHLDDIAEAQVKMLSDRHVCVDKISNYQFHLSRRKANDLNYKKMRIEHYKTNKFKNQVKYEDRDIKEFINSDMALRMRYQESLSLQIQFFNQVVETLDKMGFSIKNRIAVEEYKKF